MTKKEIKRQVINCLNKNINYLNLLCVISTCEEEILKFNHESILEGDFKIPGHKDIEAVVTKKMLMEFNLSESLYTGLFDFSEMDASEKKKYIEIAKEVFVKFFHAQKKAMIMAVIDSINSRIEHLNQDFRNLRNTLLPTKQSLLRFEK